MSNDLSSRGCASCGRPVNPAQASPYCSQGCAQWAQREAERAAWWQPQEPGGQASNDRAFSWDLTDSAGAGQPGTDPPGTGRTDGAPPTQPTSDRPPYQHPQPPAPYPSAQAPGWGQPSSYYNPYGYYAPPPSGVNPQGPPQGYGTPPPPGYGYPTPGYGYGGPAPGYGSPYPPAPSWGYGYGYGQPPGPPPYLPQYPPYLPLVGKPSAWWAWGSSFGLIILSYMVVIAFGILLGWSEPVYMVATAVTIALVVWMLRDKVGQSGLADLFKMSRLARTAGLIGLVFAVDLLVVLPLANLLTPLLFPGAGEQAVAGEVEGASGAGLALLVVEVAVLTPIIEELMFRGYIFHRFKEVYPTWAAILISSVMFALLHEHTAILSAFGGGLLYAWLRSRTGSLLPSMISHALWNGLVIWIWVV